MSSPLPQPQVLVGFNNGPYDDPANITTIASPAGTLGGHNVWTDISAFVPNIDTNRGRQHELAQFEAGVCTLTGVNNNDGRFNPWNNSSPYAGKIVPMVPIQVRATWLTNLLTANDASFEGGLGTWVANTNCSVAQTTAQALDGTHSMSLTSTAAGNMIAVSASGTSGYAVVAGNPYSAVASFRSAVSARSVLVSIAWWSATGASLGASNGTTVTDSTAGWTQATVTATAPAGAAFAELEVTVQSTGAASEVHYVDEVGLWSSSNAPAWTAGGTGQTFNLFTGHINSWAPKWGDNFSQFIDITAADAFRVLAGADLASYAYSTQVATDGASSLWPLTDAVGSSTAFDVIGSLVATAVNGTGGQGQAIIPTFSGPGTDGPLLAITTGHIDFGPLTANTTSFTPDYLTVPGIASSGSWSIEFWIKIPPGDFGTWQPAVFGQNDNVGAPNFTTVTFLSGPFQIQWIVNNSSSVSHACTVAYPTDGKWHHIVLSYSSSSMSLYIDGVATTTTGSLGTATLTAGQAACLGLEASLRTGTPVCGGMQFGCLAYYPSVALSSVQVANHFSLGVGLGGPNNGTVDAQLKQALAIVGWPATAEDIVPALQAAANNTQSITATSALTAMQTLERTEEGALFMSASGKVTFRDRGTLQGQNPARPQYAVPQVFFGDDVVDPTKVATWGAGLWGTSLWGTECVRYDPGDDMALDELDVVNQAVVTRVGGVAQVANSAGSQTTYGLKSTSVSAVHQNDTTAQAHANWIVAKESSALFRLRSLVVNLIDAIGEDTIGATPASGQTYSRVAQLLGLDLMYRVRTKRVGSVGLEQDALVEGIEWKITPDSWYLTVRLSTTDTYSAAALWGS